MANSSRLDMRISDDLRGKLMRIHREQKDDDFSKTVRKALEQYVELYPVMDEIKKFLAWRAYELEGNQ